MPRRLVLWAGLLGAALALPRPAGCPHRLPGVQVSHTHWGFGTWGLGTWMKLTRQPRESASTKHRGTVRMSFPLDRDTVAWPPTSAEELDCQPLGGSRFVVASIPFLVRGVAVGDIVTAAGRSDGVLRFDRVATRKGHSTIRLEPGDPILITAVRAEFEALGCPTQWSDSWGVIAIDVPADVDQPVVRAAVESGSSKARWSFEAGSLAPAWSTEGVSPFALRGQND